MNNIIGAQVVTKYGETVGDIENLIVDPKGRITSAIIDIGGFLGIGSKKVAIQFDKLQNIGPFYVMYPHMEKRLENMPEFNPEQLG